MKCPRAVFAVLAAAAFSGACAPPPGPYDRAPSYGGTTYSSPTGGYYNPSPNYAPPYAYGGVAHPLDQGTANIEWNNQAIYRRQRANEGSIQLWHGPSRSLDEMSRAKRHWDYSWDNFKRSFKIK